MKGGSVQQMQAIRKDDTLAFHSSSHGAAYLGLAGGGGAPTLPIPIRQPPNSSTSLGWQRTLPVRPNEAPAKHSLFSGRMSGGGSIHGRFDPTLGLTKTPAVSRILRDKIEAFNSDCDDAAPSHALGDLSMDFGYVDFSAPLGNGAITQSPPLVMGAATTNATPSGPFLTTEIARSISSHSYESNMDVDDGSVFSGDNNSVAIFPDETFGLGMSPTGTSVSDYPLPTSATVTAEAGSLYDNSFSSSLSPVGSPSSNTTFLGPVGLFQPFQDSIQNPIPPSSPTPAGVSPTSTMPFSEQRPSHGMSPMRITRRRSTAQPSQRVRVNPIRASRGLVDVRPAVYPDQHQYQHTQQHLQRLQPQLQVQPPQQSHFQSTQVPNEEYFEIWGSIVADDGLETFAPTPQSHELQAGLEDIIGHMPLVNNSAPAGPPEVSTDPWPNMSGTSRVDLPLTDAWILDGPLLGVNTVLDPPSLLQVTYSPSILATPSTALPPIENDLLGPPSRSGSLRQHSRPDLLPIMQPQAQSSAGISHQARAQGPAQSSSIVERPAVQIPVAERSQSSSSTSSAVTIRKTTVASRTKSPKRTSTAAGSSARSSANPENQDSALKLGPPQRGKRNSPLDVVTKTKARKARANKSVCIRCRTSRQACTIVEDDPDGRCEACLKLGNGNAWAGICTKAHFYDTIIDGSLNYISQLAVNHPIPNSQERVRINLSQTIHLDDILASLNHVRNHFNVGVEQGGKQIYVMDLDECHGLLSKIRDKVKMSERDLRTFIDNDITNIDGWQNCVTDSNPFKDLLSLISIWNNMPSRARYSYVWKNHAQHISGLGSTGGAMDPQGADRDNIILAAQLSRIICRKLELEAFNLLQKKLNNSIPPNDAVQFLRKLGNILVQLRWRFSWWKVLGGGGRPVAGAATNTETEKEKEKFEYRVQTLCRTLYFYYCAIRRCKLPSFIDLEQEELDGVWSRYADTETKVFDKFPENESKEGFEEWMEKGKALIEKAGARSKVSLIKGDATR